METWLKYQIEYIRRMWHKKLSKEQIEAIKWYLSLDKKDREVFLVVLKKKNNIDIK